MRWHAAVVVVTTFTLGCGGGGGSGARSSAAAAVTSSAIARGHVEGATPGALVHLVVPDPSATSLEALAGTIVDSVEVQPDGAFTVDLVPGASEVLVSAPGCALTRAALDALEIALAPEARIDVRVTGVDARPERLALALVLDPLGRPMPVPVVDAVASDEGTLALTRLPAGTWEVLVSSADGERFGRASVVVGPGGRARLDVSLADDLELARRFARAVGVREEDPLPQDDVATGGAP